MLQILYSSGGLDLDIFLRKKRNITLKNEGGGLTAVYKLYKETGVFFCRRPLLCNGGGGVLAQVVVGEIVVIGLRRGSNNLCYELKDNFLLHLTQFDGREIRYGGSEQRLNKPLPNGLGQLFSEYKPLLRHLVFIIFLSLLAPL